MLYLNKQLFIFGKHDTKFCSFCNQEDETVIHLFADCSKTKTLWIHLKTYFQHSLELPSLCPQSAVFGFLQADRNVFLTLNHLLLLFKNYIYMSRSSRSISLSGLLKIIKKVCILEKSYSKYSDKKQRTFNVKWGKIQHLFIDSGWINLKIFIQMRSWSKSNIWDGNFCENS